MNEKEKAKRRYDAKGLDWTGIAKLARVQLFPDDQNGISWEARAR